MELVAGADNALVLRRRALAKARGRRRLMLVLGTLGVLLFAGGYEFLATSSVFAVHRIQVTGAPPWLAKEIRNAARPRVGDQSLLQLDTGSVVRSVSAQPYVQSVSVDRKFPNTLAIHITAYRPAVYVQAGTLGYLVSRSGRVLQQVTAWPNGLPRVQLPPGTALSVGHQNGDVNLAGALAVLRAIPPHFEAQVGPIHDLVSGSGTVAMLIGQHVRIRLGQATQLALKLEVAKRVIGRIQGGQRANLSYLDVTAPARPALGWRTLSHP
jgi:cell division septal protein FtsQ